MGAGRHVQSRRIIVDHVEQTQIGKRLDRHAGDVIERFLDFERTMEHLTRSNEQGKALLRPVAGSASAVSVLRGYALP